MKRDLDKRNRAAAAERLACFVHLRSFPDCRKNASPSLHPSITLFKLCRKTLNYFSLLQCVRICHLSNDGYIWNLSFFLELLLWGAKCGRYERISKLRSLQSRLTYPTTPAREDTI
jgi:hypothetical protein